VPVDRDPREENVDGNEEDPGQTPGSGEAALDISGVGEKPRTVRIDRGDGIEIRTFDGGWHDGVS
jgi:hypothetical protein